MNIFVYESVQSGHLMENTWQLLQIIIRSGKYDTLLVDLEKGVAAKIGDSLMPVGWLNTTKK